MPWSKSNERIQTHREFRNRGFGTALLTHALKCAWKEHCYKVMLLTGRREQNVFWLYEKARVCPGCQGRADRVSAGVKPGLRPADRLGGGEDPGAERAQAAERARRGGAVERGDPADHPSGQVSCSAVDEGVAARRCCGCPRGRGEGQPLSLSAHICAQLCDVRIRGGEHQGPAAFTAGVFVTSPQRSLVRGLPACLR